MYATIAPISIATIEAAVSQVKAQLQEKDQSAGQSDPSVMMMEMMRQIMDRMDALENRKAAPTIQPTRSPTPPQPSAIPKRRFPNPELFDGTRNKY
jgi:hypothetical protein